MPSVKWDPQMQNMTYLNQSAHLYTSYYYLQMVIHRPYLPSPRKHHTSPFPSLAICTNAARSCVHVTYIQYTRSAASTWQNIVCPPHCPRILSPSVSQITLFASAVVLLLNIWTGKRAGANIHSEELTNVHQAILMLKTMEKRFVSPILLWLPLTPFERFRWHIAGKFRWVMIYYPLIATDKARFLETYSVNWLQQEIYHCHQYGRMTLHSRPRRQMRQRPVQCPTRILRHSAPDYSRRRFHLCRPSSKGRLQMHYQQASSLATAHSPCTQMSSVDILCTLCTALFNPP